MKTCPENYMWYKYKEITLYREGETNILTFYNKGLYNNNTQNINISSRCNDTHLIEQIKTVLVKQTVHRTWNTEHCMIML